MQLSAAQREGAAARPREAAPAITSSHTQQGAGLHYSPGAGDPKQFSSLRARAALAGVELHASRNDAERWCFIVTAGALTQELATLGDVERWLQTCAVDHLGVTTD